MNLPKSRAGSALPAQKSSAQATSDAADRSSRVITIRELPAQAAESQALPYANTFVPWSARQAAPVARAEPEQKLPTLSVSSVIHNAALAKPTRFLQQSLMKISSPTTRTKYLPEGSATGNYLANTSQAVKQFQTDSHLHPDQQPLAPTGEADHDTQLAIHRAANAIELKGLRFWRG